jgi:hypothetical protein
MTSPRTFRPDLAEAVLEDRTLMAYSPSAPQLTLTTSGYVGITTPPGLSANLNTMGGFAFGGGGGNMGNGFYITGFGMSTMSVGDALGLGGTAGSASTQGGAGGGGGGGGNSSSSSNTRGQGGTSDMLDALHIGETSASSDGPAAGESGAGGQGSTPLPAQEPTPPVPAASSPS